jgi:hypothetical protein
MTYDFNTAGPQQSMDVIPDKTIAVVQLTIRPGNAGEGGILARSKNGLAEGLDTKLTTVGGSYNKRTFFDWMTLSGQGDNYATAADITKRKLRAIVESARNIKPTDVSEAAKKARIVELADFDGIRFMCRIGVEPAKDGYRAKNFIAAVITPDDKEYQPVEQAPKTPTPPPPSAVIVKPAWAQ